MYVDFESYGKTAFLFAYPKSELTNITDRQKQSFKRVITAIMENFQKGKKG